MKIHPVIRALILLLGACLYRTAAAQADAPRLYDVEVIVFSQNGDLDGEQFGVPHAAGQHPRGAFPADQFTELSQSAYSLNRIQGALTATRGYKVLFHRAWRQLAYDREHAVDYPVHSIATNGRDSVDGTVTLIRERFLHLDVDLTLMRAAASSGVAYSDGPGSTPVYRLTENRRIRSSDILYYDHPRLGVIARVTPVEQAGSVPENNPPEAPAPAGDDTPVTEDEPAPADNPPAR